ncbi:DUF6934 family protein [Chitinophaga eiseniae]|uniref:Uncharacterized protein n=1 Tax=Chitinophaga eiseniae TaxID=634771 RepID=A0A847SPX5_9BACT|nr:hypothetical protein [Chitinophaga eiseniae]NLR82344.1 hypothetical protein [Chitinophaga eiseniae]
MKHEVYKNLTIADDLSIFEFFSIGPKGVILKRILFMTTEYPDTVNLAFGDIDKNGEINDFVISNNGDRDKILATVCHVIGLYLKKYPNRQVYFKGSTAERTRLYRIIINNNIKWFNLQYNILIEQEFDFVPFQPNISTIGFLIKKKII